MILTLPQIEKIVTKNPNQDIILRGRQRSRALRMHMYGEGLSEHLKVIQGFEKQWMRDLRVMYTRTNVDLFERLSRPKDMVWSARGGSIHYNLSETQERRAVDLSVDVVDGYSIREWLENVWATHCDDDPAGVLMMEMLPKKEAVLAKQQGRSFVYPTYKSIFDIFDYQPKGVKLDWICFQLTREEAEELGYMNGEQLFRLVDDANDYIVMRDNNKAIVQDQHTIINSFGMVPAMINSDLVDPLNKGCFLSLYSKLVSVADEFLRKGSIKVTSDFRNGFPKYAEYADDCPKCKGEGVADGSVCNECNGYGRAAMVYVSDVKLLNWPADKDKPHVLPKDVGAYVEPSKNYHEISVSDMIMLENILSLTLWGVQSQVRATGTNLNGTGEPKTATEITSEIKPKADRLTPISKTVEKRHKFILDLVIRLQIAYNYQGSSVHYGRRYMMEGPDALWEKYSAARAKGVSISALDDLLIDYYEAKYESNPLKLAVMIKLMKVEPFIHFKPTEVGAFRLSQEDYKAKIFYGEWLSERTSGELYAFTAAELRASLVEYAGKKKLEEVQKMESAA
jgi:hypothetical protein